MCISSGFILRAVVPLQGLRIQRNSDLSYLESWLEFSFIHEAFETFHRESRLGVAQLSGIRSGLLLMNKI